MIVINDIDKSDLRLGFVTDDGRYVLVGDVIKYDDGTHQVQGIVRLGKYKMLSEREEIHYGYYIEWQDDGANKWSEWWRQDILFWLSDRNCQIIGNINDTPELINTEE